MTIGIIDTGIDVTSPEFAGRIASASGDVAGSRGLTNPDSDHGTNVAMVAAAARDNTGIMGIAWNATIAMFRADEPGTCATYDPNNKDSGCSFNDPEIATGIDRAVAAGAKVINLSLGGSQPSALVTDAVSRAAAAGTVIVVSAGNDGDSTEAGIDPNNPDPFAAGLKAAGNGNVIIAGSVDKNNIVSVFSNRAGSLAGSYLMARGEDVCCSYSNGQLEVVTNSDGSRSVYVFSGTSFSAPQIAGAVALLRQAFPNLSAQQVVDLLLRTATDAGASGVDSIYGRGILNLTAAFAPQGATTLAGTTTAISLGQSALTTSAAMGDAATQGGHVNTVVLDAYQRAYQVDLAAGMRSSGLNPKLAGALTGQSRNLSLGSRSLSLAFNVDDRSATARLPWSGQLRLSGIDGEMARVLATRVALQISPRDKIAFGFAQGADGLVAQLQGQSQPAFLIAGSPLDDLGFARNVTSSFALRHQFGRLGLTASGDSGRLAADSRDPAQIGFYGLTPARTSRLGLSLDRRFGAVDAALGASWLKESNSLLGARLASGLALRGADNLFFDASAAWRPAPGWRLGASWRTGLTWGQSGGLVAAGSRLRSSAWAIDAERIGVLGSSDSLALRLSQPLRVESGALALSVPVDYSYQTLAATPGLRFLNLAPKGREIDAELAWRGPLWDGAALASLYYRRDPGHFAGIPDDQGIAIGWTRKF